MAGLIIPPRECIFSLSMDVSAGIPVVPTINESKKMAQKIVYSANFKRDYVAFFAVILFFAMIASEVLLAVSVPAYMSRENVLANEVVKRKMLLRFDSVRAKCNNINSSNETLMLEKQLISEQFEQLAIYLRAESDRLTPDEILKMSDLMLDLERIVARLGAGKAYSKENRLDSSEYVNSLVKKYALEGEK